MNETLEDRFYNLGVIKRPRTEKMRILNRVIFVVLVILYFSLLMVILGFTSKLNHHGIRI